ncbi:MAG: hypothetical protein IPG56_05945 [Caulobacteraceae bacterium]|nr:hypothetical protein [Caulobacteraceae bacterium]
MTAQPAAVAAALQVAAVVATAALRAQDQCCSAAARSGHASPHCRLSVAACVVAGVWVAAGAGAGGAACASAGSVVCAGGVSDIGCATAGGAAIIAAAAIANGERKDFMR